MKKNTWLYLLFSVVMIFISASSCKKTGTNGNSVRLPTLNTDVSVVTKNSVKFASFISSDGGATITSKGFCYSSSPNPTISSNNISGIEADNIYATVTGLTPSTIIMSRLMQLIMRELLMENRKPLQLWRHLL